MRSLRPLPPALACVALAALLGCSAPHEDAALATGLSGETAADRAEDDLLRLARSTSSAPPTTTTTTIPPTTTTVAPPTTAPPTTEPPAPPAPAAAATAQAPAPAPAVGTDPGGASQLFAMMNAERDGAHVPRLSQSGGAGAVARDWAAVMAREQTMRHNPNLGGDLSARGVGWSRCGENVGYGTSTSQVHAMFMGSGGHRANILDPGYTSAGVGVASAGGKVWVVVVFVG